MRNIPEGQRPHPLRRRNIKPLRDLIDILQNLQIF